MSFLLRNNRRYSNNNSNNAAGRNFRQKGDSEARIIPQPRSISLPRSNNQSQGLIQRHPKYASRSGNQIQIQRSVEQQKRMTHPRTTTKQAAGAQSQRQEVAGVISMSEVLEDLRVLEQQQREAQRKLANARVTKDHRLQQQTALETQLEQQKYKNGELRAQLRQFREFLSCGTRELGARRLAGGHTGDSIRGFEQRLKKGLQSQRLNTLLVRKIDSLIIHLENKGAILVRLNAESKEKVNILEQEILSAKRCEEGLRNAIQTEVSRAHRLVDEVAALRVESTKLEQELLAAQSAEESTRLRVEAIDAQLESENKSHKQVLTDLEAQLRSYKIAKQDLVAEEAVLTKSFEESCYNLKDMKLEIVSFQHKEGHATSPYSDDFQEPVPAFEKSMFTFQLAANEAKVGAQGDKNAQLKKNIEKLRSFLKQARSETIQNQEQVVSLIDFARRQEAIEKDRLQTISGFQRELEREREVVVELHKSSLELLKDREMEASSHARAIVGFDEAIAKDQEVVATLQMELDTKSSSAKDISDAWETTKIHLDHRLDESKDLVASAQRAIDDTEDQVLHLNDECTRKLEDELAEFDMSKAARLEKVQAKLSRLQQRYPRLKEIEFTYDSSKTIDQQAEEVLEVLVSELEGRISAARQARDVAAEELATARRKAEQAAVEIRRKEEERRRQRERLQTEVSSHEAEECIHSEADACGKTRSTLEASLEESFEEAELHAIQSCTKRKVIKDKKRGPKKRRGYDFYNPIKEASIPDEEPLVEPKRLLPTFESRLESPPATQMTATTQSSDKRVRWEDEDKDDENAVLDQKSDLDQGVLKIELPKVASRRKRQYGSLNKGVASLPTSRNMQPSRDFRGSQRSKVLRDRPITGSAERGDNLRNIQNDDGSVVLSESKRRPRHKKAPQAQSTEISRVSSNRGAFLEGDLSSNRSVKKAAGDSSRPEATKSNAIGVSRRSHIPTREREQHHFDSLITISSHDNDHAARSKKKRLNEETERTGRSEPDKGKRKKSRSGAPVVNEWRRRSSGDDENGTCKSTKGNSSKQSRAASKKCHKENAQSGQEPESWKDTEDKNGTSKKQVRAHRTSRNRIQDARSQPLKGRKNSMSPVGKSLQPLDLNANQPPSSASRLHESKAHKIFSGGSRESSASLKTSCGSRKRKSSEMTSTQTSGLSSSERGTKARRRKKKEPVASKKNLPISIGEDAYDFHF